MVFTSLPRCFAAQAKRSRDAVAVSFGKTELSPEYGGGQFRYGDASGMIAAAEAAVLQATQQWTELCTREPAAFTREEELSLATISRESVRLCWRAVESELFPTAGSSSVQQGRRVERVWREMSTVHSHAGFGVFLTTLANRELTRARFNVA